MKQEQWPTPQEKGVQNLSAEFRRIEKLLMQKGTDIQKETRFGRVFISDMPVNIQVPANEAQAYYIDIFLRSSEPEKIETNYKLYSDGSTKVSAQRGWAQTGEEIKPPYLLSEVLCEI